MTNTPEKPEISDEKPDGRGFEDSLDQLDEIVTRLDEGDLGLAEALATYEKGVGLLRRCHGILEAAQRRIEVLSGVDAEGNPVVSPFAEGERPPPSPASPPGTRRARGAKKPTAPPDEPEIDTNGSLF